MVLRTRTVMDLGRILTVTMVVMAVFTRTIADQTCGTQTCTGNQQCRHVRQCSTNTDCQIEPKCLASGYILYSTAVCPDTSYQPVLSVVSNIFYTTLSLNCDLCTGDNLQCTNNVCCASLPAEPPEPRADPSTIAPQSCPPACRINCKYGMSTDVDGCPKCSCHDPCDGVLCPAGEKCEVAAGQECTAETCGTGQQTECVADSTCPLVPLCRALCEHGHVLDDQGCMLCACKEELCEGVSCPDGQVCAGCKDSTDYCPTTGYICVEQETRTNPLCSGVSCRMLCEFGHAKDSNGCDACTCASAPCQTTTCGIGQTCTNEKYDCEDGLCYRGKCEDGPTSRDCPLVSPCGVQCPFGTLNDAQGCDTCFCKTAPDTTIDLCAPITCPGNLRCEETEPANCFEATCTKIPMCVCPGVHCRILCSDGFAKDSDGCDMCRCNNSCENMNCQSGTECKIQNGVPECVSSITGSTCSGITCRKLCSTGFAVDEEGCSMCTCKEPTSCSQMTCRDNEICVLKDNPNCGLTRCDPTPVCLSKDFFTIPTTASTTTTTTTTTTTPSPAVTEGECPQAVANDYMGIPCPSGTCSAGQKCCPSIFSWIKVCKTPVTSGKSIESDGCNFYQTFLRSLGVNIPCN